MLASLASCSDYGTEPLDLFQLVKRCCDCFEGDPAEPDGSLPDWLFSASEWLVTPELSELMAMFVSLFQEYPLGYGQKVCSAVGFWIRRHPAHFDANPQLCRLLERLKRLAAADESIPRTLVEELLDISTIPSYAWLRNVSVRNPVARHVSLCFEQWSPEDIATSMSHIDYKVLSRVHVGELKRYARAGRLSQTPILERSIAVFNCFSGWVQCQVLAKGAPRDRAEVICKFVHVGRHLRRQNNFNTLMAVIGGITHSSIARLVQTRALLPVDIVGELGALTELLSHSNNYAAYRRALRECGHRFKIPIMGVHLKDLIAFWHSAGLERVEKSRHISERCLGQLAQLLSHFLGVNRTPHNFADANLDLINTLKVLFDITYDERELYELSLKCEPKSVSKQSPSNSSSSPPPMAEQPVFADWAAGVCVAPNPETVDKHIASMVDAVFRHYDHDRDGYISRAEFEQFAGNFPLLDAFMEIDTDRDGQISRAEMCLHFQQLNKRTNNGNSAALPSSLTTFRNGFTHNWCDSAFLAPALCAHCNKLLWMRHGVRCRDCAFAAHEQCKGAAVLECRRPSPVSVTRTSSESERPREGAAGTFGSWLGASLSPRFTGIGPSPRHASESQTMGNGHARFKRGRTRTSSASSASENSSQHSAGANYSHQHQQQMLDNHSAAAGALQGFLIGTSLRSSFHRLLRKNPATVAKDTAPTKDSNANSSTETKATNRMHNRSSSSMPAPLEQRTASLASEEVFDEA